MYQNRNMMMHILKINIRLYFLAQTHTLLQPSESHDNIALHTQCSALSAKTPFPLPVLLLSGTYVLSLQSQPGTHTHTHPPSFGALLIFHPSLVWYSLLCLLSQSVHLFQSALSLPVLSYLD